MVEFSVQQAEVNHLVHRSPSEVHKLVLSFGDREGKAGTERRQAPLLRSWLTDVEIEMPLRVIGLVTSSST